MPPNLIPLSRFRIITWSSALCTFGGGTGASGRRRPGFEGRWPSCREAARNAPTPPKCQSRRNFIAGHPCRGEADPLIILWREPPHGGGDPAKGGVVDLSARPVRAGITNGWGSSADARKRAGWRPSARAYPMGWVSGPQKTVSVGCRRSLRAAGGDRTAVFSPKKGVSYTEKLPAPLDKRENCVILSGIRRCYGETVQQIALLLSEISAWP